MELNDVRVFREAVHRLQRNLSWQWKSNATCCGITVAQCHALLEVGKCDEISLVELASNLGLDTSTLSRTIDGMVQAGLVKRRANPEDRRYLHITLTEQGKEVYDRINFNFDHYVQEVFAGIPADKHRQVLESITLLAKTFSNNKCCPEVFTQ